MGVTKKLSALSLVAALGTATAGQGVAYDLPQPPSTGPVATSSPLAGGISFPGGSISLKNASAMPATISNIDFAACSGGGEAEFQACAEHTAASRREDEMKRIIGGRNNFDAVRITTKILGEGTKPANGRFEPDVYGRALLNRIASPKP